MMLEALRLRVEGQDSRSAHREGGGGCAGKPVLAMKAALKIDWSTVPTDGEELFGRQPNFSTEPLAQRIAMKRIRKDFPPEHADALARWNAGQRDVVFPAGTVRMRLRHNVATEPIPDFLGTS
ncbi:MAG: hypothetical protein KUG77_16635 [Nannocystaceae bacterium]|nr:hypothetical protein [Nannocystaceae bacterium]